MKARTFRVLLARPSTPRPVDTSTPHGWTVRIASATLSGSRPPARISRRPPAHLRRGASRRPGPTRRGASTSTMSAPYSAARASRSSPAGKAWMTSGTRAATYPQSSNGLGPVELGGVEARADDDLDDPLRLLVAEHPDRADLRRQPPRDGAHGVRAHLAGRGREDEADGVGAHRHGQQGVLLARDPADLHPHEHGPADAAPRRRPTGRASAPAPRRRGRRRNPAAASRPTSAARLDTGLGDVHDSWRDIARPRGRALAVDLEAVQVPLVHADERGADVEGPLELVLVVHLDEGGHAEIAGEPVQVAPARVCRAAATISSTASAPMMPGVVDVGRADGEVLAQHGKPDGVARRGQVLGAAAEVRPVGEHRQAGRAARSYAGRPRPGRGRRRGRPWTATAA